MNSVDMLVNDQNHPIIYQNQLQLNQSLDLPVMSKLTSLSIRPAAEFMFHDFFNEDYLPVLTTVLLQVKHTSDRLNVSAYLNLWKGHRGIKYFRLELEEEWQNVGANVIGRKIVRVFPSVTKFDLRAWLGEDIVIQAIEQMMTPYQKWELEDVSVTGDHVTKSSVLVAVLKNVVRWKGAYSIFFASIYFCSLYFLNDFHLLGMLFAC